MSLWRGILQRRDDEWTSSLRGLDGLEAKPVFHNENIPAFRHHGAKLGFKKDLRTDEQAQKDFSPFVNKKIREYLHRLRKSQWLGSDIGISLEDWIASLTGEMSARDAYRAQDAPFTDTDAGLFGDDDEALSRYTGQSEDEAEFEGLDDMEILDNPHEPGTAEYNTIERRNYAVSRYQSMTRMTYKDRQLERLGLAFQSATTLEEKQRAYDEYYTEWTKYAPRFTFIRIYGERPTNPEEVMPSRLPSQGDATPASVGGGGSAPAPATATPATAASASERQAYIAWDTYRTPEKNYLLGNSNFKEILRERGIPLKIDGHRATSRNHLIRLLVSKGIKPPT